MPDPPRYLLQIAYDGTNFHGWQRQEPLRENVLASNRADLPRVIQAIEHTDGDSTDDNTDRVVLRTVQHVVQEAVSRVLGQPVVIRGASRTDAGVHATSQIATFVREQANTGPDDDKLVLAINSRLPDDVIIRQARPVRSSFDPIGDCTGKGYRYRLHTGLDRPLWDRHYVHHVRHARNEFDLDAMRDVASMLTGEHDFAAFAKAGHGRESTIRTVHRCCVIEQNDNGLAIDIAGSGFLHNMVRIVAGTLVEIGKGRLTADDLTNALTTGDRRRAGPTLPPTGLCLEWINYPDDDLKFEPMHEDA